VSGLLGNYGSVGWGFESCQPDEEAEAFHNPVPHNGRAWVLAPFFCGYGAACKQKGGCRVSAAGIKGMKPVPLMSQGFLQFVPGRC